MRTFEKWCAPSKKLRTFEAGRRPASGAVDPGAPGQPLAAASFALMGQSWLGSCVQLPLYVRRAISARRENGPHQEMLPARAIPAEANQPALPHAIGSLCRFVPMREGPARKQKSRAFIFRHGSAWARFTGDPVPYSIVASLIIYSKGWVRLGQNYCVERRTQRGSFTSRDARARPKSGGSGVRRRCGPAARDSAC